MGTFFDTFNDLDFSSVRYQLKVVQHSLSPTLHAHDGSLVYPVGENGHSWIHCLDDLHKAVSDHKAEVAVVTLLAGNDVPMPIHGVTLRRAVFRESHGGVRRESHL